MDGTAAAIDGSRVTVDGGRSASVVRALLTVLRPLAVAVFLAASSAGAQVSPDAHWSTLRTPHFRVTFSDGLEATARRAAGSAERAYEGLAKELAEPRATIDLVVADNVDASNGYTTPFPTPRIVIYARPTVDANTLKFLDDWIDLVVAHEVAHVFHMDRVRGLWRLGQWVFGRNPFLFPNTYSPSWLAEGLAVHYESKLTGAGRVLGTDFGAIVRAHENAGTVPGSHALSAATPLYPLGNLAYVYGTQIVEKAASHGGPDGMRKLVDVSAGRIIPYLLNTNAEAAFGIGFDSAYTEWADSSHREAQRMLRRSRPPKALVTGAWNATRPRWADANTIVYAGADPRSVPSLREVSVNGGAVREVAERNTNDVTTPLAGGWRVFAQQEFLDPYTSRSDLWVERSGEQRRLTTGARLTHPDTRLCDAAPTDNPVFCIAAVRLGPGTAQLVTVRVRADGSELAVTPVAPASGTELYSEPRWSHAGDRIAATYHGPNGTSAIAIVRGVDRATPSIEYVGRSRAVNGSPAWGPGDSTLYFTSDRIGRSALYRAHLTGPTFGALVRVAESPTALYEVEPSPDGTKLATFTLGGSGYDLAVVDARVRGVRADSSSVLPPSHNRPQVTTDAPAGAYSAWHTVLPRYWLPLADQGFRNTTKWGFHTSGADVVDRHVWQLSAEYEPTRGESEADGQYQWSGLGNPVVTLGGSQVWDHPLLADSARKAVLAVGRRKVFADGALTFIRRRYRTFSSFSVGGAYEWRDFRELDDAPWSRFRAADRALLGKAYTYPSYFVSAGFSNARQPALALGPEDGIAISGAVRQRWRADLADATRATSMVGVMTLYRGVDLGGPIHHLITARVAAATQDATSATEFEAGGGSGSVVELAPGVTIGEGRRTFFVRGFEGGTLTGDRALGGNVEWRAPVALPARGLGALPVYFQRLSAVAFVDAATAWCADGSAASPICPKVTSRQWMSSAGVEIHLDAALQYDSPYRFRAGYAIPTSQRVLAQNPNGRAYFTVGVPF